MLALVDDVVIVGVQAVVVIVRTKVKLEAGAVNPLLCVEKSMDEVGVRGFGVVQSQCRASMRTVDVTGWTLTKATSSWCLTWSSSHHSSYQVCTFDLNDLI